MDRKAKIRGKLQRKLRRDIPDVVWEATNVQELVDDCSDAVTKEERRDLREALEEALKERLEIWDNGKKEGLRSIKSRPFGRSEVLHEATSQDSGDRRRNPSYASYHELASNEDSYYGLVFSEKTEAMIDAMNAFFALHADNLYEVEEFRERVLPGRFLTVEEACALILSSAARTFSIEWFEEWEIPYIGHSAEVLSTAPRGEEFKPVDDHLTVRVDPPGITKEVRYADPDARGLNTRCVYKNGTIVPIHLHLSKEKYGDPQSVRWIWPGSLVDDLYQLSFILEGLFDWKPAVRKNMIQAETLSFGPTAATFVLTGEAPGANPIDAVVEAPWGFFLTPYDLNREWLMELTFPYWLPDKEVLQAFRVFRTYRGLGLKLPRTKRPLEVARFVWERKRIEGRFRRPTWTSWTRQWNDEYPEKKFQSASHFRTYFLRGEKYVESLNF